LLVDAVKTGVLHDISTIVPARASKLKQKYVEMERTCPAYIEMLAERETNK